LLFCKVTSDENNADQNRSKKNDFKRLEVNTCAQSLLLFASQFSRNDFAQALETFLGKEKYRK